MDSAGESTPEENEAWKIVERIEHRSPRGRARRAQNEARKIVERIEKKRDWSKLAKLQFCRDGSRSKQEYDIKCFALRMLEEREIVATRYRNAKSEFLFVVEDGGKPGERGRNCLVGWYCEYAFKNLKDAKNFANAYKKFERKYFKEMRLDGESIVRIVQEKVIEVEKRRLYRRFCL